MAYERIRSLLAGLGLLGAAPCLDERKRQIAEAQARGGCVEASYCDTGTLKATFPRVCYPSPAERQAVINDIKASEIEAAILEQFADEADKPESNAPDAQQHASDAASKLETERQGLESVHVAYQAQIARAAALRAELARLRDVAKRDRDNLAALQRSVGIA